MNHRFIAGRSWYSWH